MPVIDSVDIDWPSVRLLAITVGVREAARRLGISEEATMKRSQREGWLATPETRHAAARSVQERAPSALSAAVRTPAQVMAQELTELGGKSRISLARGLHKAASRVEEMPGDEVLANASDISSTVKSLSTVHGWSAQAPSAKINLSVVSGESSGITLEAEVVSQTPDDDELAGF